MHTSHGPLITHWPRKTPKTKLLFTFQGYVTSHVKLRSKLFFPNYRLLTYKYSILKKHALAIKLQSQIL